MFPFQGESVRLRPPPCPRPREAGVRSSRAGVAVLWLRSGHEPVSHGRRRRGGEASHTELLQRPGAAATRNSYSEDCTNRNWDTTSTWAKLETYNKCTMTC